MIRPLRFLVHLTDRLSPAAVLVCSFGIAILIGSILLCLPIAHDPGQSFTYLDSLFTATSATCVTGLIVVDTGTAFTRFGQVVILILIQIGGLGIMTFSTMFALMLGREMGMRDSVLIWDTLSMTGAINVYSLLKSIALFTFGIEFFGTTLLAFKFVPAHGVAVGLFEAIFHSISAFCNAGFALFPDSLSSYAGDWFLNLTVMTLIVTGGLGFVVMLNIRSALKARWRKEALPERINIQTRVVIGMSVGLIVVGALLFFVLEYRGVLHERGIGEQVLCTLFQAVTPRTAGFNTIDFGAVSRPTLFVTMILMFIGGAPGSTAGGIKTTTAAVAAGMLKAILRNEHNFHFLGRNITTETANKVLAIMILSLSVLIVAAVALMITEPLLRAEALLFELFSAFGTVGLSTGITAALSVPGRLILIAVMFIGRVGPLTLALAISQRKGSPVLIKYPDAKIMIG